LGEETLEHQQCDELEGRVEEVHEGSGALSSASGNTGVARSVGTQD
jgi:hypothetical protein